MLHSPIFLQSFRKLYTNITILVLSSVAFCLGHHKTLGREDALSSIMKLKPHCAHLQNSTNWLYTIKARKHVINVCLLIRSYSYFMHSFEDFHYTCKIKFKSTEMKNLEYINKRSKVHLFELSCRKSTPHFVCLKEKEQNWVLRC